MAKSQILMKGKKAIYPENKKNNKKNNKKKKIDLFLAFRRKAKIPHSEK